MNSLWDWLRSGRGLPLRLYLISLIVRLIPVLLSIHIGIGLDDMFQYDMIARSLASGNGFRWYEQADLKLIEPYIHIDFNTGHYDPRGVLTSFRPPLYPAFLALIYKIIGTGTNRFFVARLVQAFLAAALAPLTYTLSRRFFPANNKAAPISGWVITFYPMLVIYPLSLATENLFFLLVLSSTLLVLVAGEKRTWPWFVLSGISLGLTSLTRSVSLVFAGMVILWIWFALHEWRMAGLVLICLLAVTFPWMARNTLINHRLTGIESSLGYDLYIGYHPEGSGTFQYPQSLDLMSILDDGLRDKIGQEKALAFIKANPERDLGLIIRRLGYFFGLERRALTYFYSNDFFGFIPVPVLLAIAAVFLLPFIIVSSSSLFGLATVPWGRGPVLLALIMAGYIAPHLVIISEDRFHLSIVPFLAILAAQAWTGGWKTLRERWQTPKYRLILILAALGVILLFLNWGLELLRDSDKIVQLLGPNGNQTYYPY